MTALVSSKFAVVLRSDARSQPDVPTTAESNRTAWRSPPRISVSKPTATIVGVRHSADAGIVVKSRTIPAHHAKAFIAFDSISVMIAAEVKNQLLVGVR